MTPDGGGDDKSLARPSAHSRGTPPSYSMMAARSVSSELQAAIVATVATDELSRSVAVAEIAEIAGFGKVCIRSECCMNGM